MLNGQKYGEVLCIAQSEVKFAASAIAETSLTQSTSLSKITSLAARQT